MTLFAQDVWEAYQEVSLFEIFPRLQSIHHQARINEQNRQLIDTVYTGEPNVAIAVVTKHESVDMTQVWLDGMRLMYVHRNKLYHPYAVKVW